MGLTVKNRNNYELSDNLASFFKLTIDEENPLPDYSSLVHDVNNSDLDIEEKANLVNLVNSLKIAKTPKEQQRLIKEIEKLKDKYEL